MTLIAVDEDELESTSTDKITEEEDVLEPARIYEYSDKVGGL